MFSLGYHTGVVNTVIVCLVVFMEMELDGFTDLVTEWESGKLISMFANQFSKDLKRLNQRVNKII